MYINGNPNHYTPNMHSFLIYMAHKGEIPKLHQDISSEIQIIEVF